MAHHFEFDSQHRILRLVMKGDVQGEEIVVLSAEIRAQVSRLRPAAGISDFSAVENFNVSAQAMRTAAVQPSPYPSEIPRYIVAPTDFLFGMARMYEQVADRPDSKLQVVRRMEDALAGLGAADAKFEAVS
jgi:hypothetical protein